MPVRSLIEKRRLTPVKNSACLMLLIVFIISQFPFGAGADSPAITPGAGIREVRLDTTESEVVGSQGRPDEVYESQRDDDIYYS